jgi:transcriptional regulator with XRE-family HTH domain
MLTVEQAFDSIQNLTNAKISQEEFGKALGTGRANISKRIKNKSVLTLEETKKIESYFNVVLLEGGVKNLALMPLNTVDRIEIGYWEGLPDDLKKTKVQSVWFDREIIENDWEMSPNSLCIIPMIGDKMAHYWYPITSGDILIVDTSQNYIMGNGVYFATSQNNTRFWIREMQVLINNNVQIKGFAPSGETTKVFTPEQLKEVDFKLIGKVIKNVSFRL